MRLIVLLVVAMFSLAGHGHAAPGDGKPKAKPKKKSALWIRREKEFREALDQWIGARTAVYREPGKCTRCGGVGTTHEDPEMRDVFPCRGCGGTRKRTDRDAFYLLRRISRGEPWALSGDRTYLGSGCGHVSKIEVIRTGLLSPTKAFAEVRYTHDGGTDEAVLRWRWGRIGQGRMIDPQAWGLYIKSAKTFPKIPPRPKPDAKRKAGDWDESTRKAVVAALAAAKLDVHIESGAVKDGTYTLRVRVRRQIGAKSLHAWIVDNSVAVCRALAPALPDWVRMHVVWLAYWQDRFGARTWKPFIATRIPHKDFERAVWKNLTPEQQRGLFTWEEPPFPGHHVVDMQPALEEK